MKTKLTLLASLLLVPLAASSSHAAQVESGSTVEDKVKVAWYVSPQGSDSNPGTVNQPFQTPEAARDAVRAYKAKHGLPAGGITVFFRAGVYEFAESFSLNEGDSGTVNSRISYEAYPGEQAIFSGGKILDPRKFTRVTDPVIRERLPDAVAGHQASHLDVGDVGHIAQRQRRCREPAPRMARA